MSLAPWLEKDVLLVLVVGHDIEDVQGEEDLWLHRVACCLGFEGDQVVDLYTVDVLAVDLILHLPFAYWFFWDHFETVVTSSGNHLGALLHLPSFVMGLVMVYHHYLLAHLCEVARLAISKHSLTLRLQRYWTQYQDPSVAPWGSFWES